jgi:hypothetical protein
MAEGVFYLYQCWIARAASFQCSRSLICSVRPEPHTLTAAGAVKRCGSGAKPAVQNKQLRKNKCCGAASFWCGSGWKILMREPEPHLVAATAPPKWCGSGSTTLEKTVPPPRFETCLLCWTSVRSRSCRSRIALPLRLRLHPMMWLDAAPYGSSSCIVNTAFQFFFTLNSILQNL